MDRQAHLQQVHDAAADPVFRETAKTLANETTVAGVRERLATIEDPYRRALALAAYGRVFDANLMLSVVREGLGERLAQNPHFKDPVLVQTLTQDLVLDLKRLGPSTQAAGATLSVLMDRGLVGPDHWIVGHLVDLISERAFRREARDQGIAHVLSHVQGLPADDFWTVLSHMDAPHWRSAMERTARTPDDWARGIWEAHPSALTLDTFKPVPQVLAQPVVRDALVRRLAVVHPSALGPLTHELITRAVTTEEYRAVWRAMARVDGAGARTQADSAAPWFRGVLVPEDMVPLLEHKDAALRSWALTELARCSAPATESADPEEMVPPPAPPQIPVRRGR